MQSDCYCVCSALQQGNTGIADVLLGIESNCTISRLQCLRRLCCDYLAGNGGYACLLTCWRIERLSLLEQRLDRNQFDLNTVRRMGTGRIDISDLVTVVYGLLPLLFGFDFSILFLKVVECTDISMFADFMRPVLMIIGRPDLQVDLVLAVTMGFQLQVDLFAVRYDCIIVVRNFLNHIIPVNPLVSVNFAVLLASEIRMTDTEVRKFNLIPSFAGNGLMIGIVSALDLEIAAVHFIHPEGEYLILQVSRQFGSVLVFEGLGNINALFNVSLVISGLEVIVPFCCGIEIFLCHDPACAGTVVLVHSRFRRKENTCGGINRQAGGIIGIENDMVQNIFFYISVVSRVPILFNGPAFQSADDCPAVLILNSNLKLLDFIIAGIGHVEDNGLSFIFYDFPAVLRHDVLHVGAVDINGCILSSAERRSGQVDCL